MIRSTTSATAACGLRLLAAAASLLLASAAAQAHKPSDAYLTLAVNGSLVAQRLDIALRDLDRDLQLDADDNGALTWGEVRGRWTDIEHLAERSVSWQADGRSCAGGPAGSAQLDEHTDGRYVVLTRTWRCGAPVQAVSVNYALFKSSDPDHRGVTQVRFGERVQPAVLVPGAGPRVFSANDGGVNGAAGATGAASAHGGSFAATLWAFIGEGVHHILIGTDHVLFLLSLLLPVVLVLRRAGGPPRRGTGMGMGTGTGRLAAQGGGSTAMAAAATLRMAAGFFMAAPAAPRAAAGRATMMVEPLPSAGARTMFWSVLKVVTAFTVAHSITLALAALDIVNPPSRWIESVIAASVVLAALNNLVPLVGEGRWKITFVFGLVHGFGFASVLKDLGLAQSTIAAPLLGFNLGVELGQLMIVAAFLPLAWALRATAFYRTWVFRGGSLVIAVLASVWLVERVFDVVILGFGR
jgi:HupE / UreJ protein